MSFRDVMRLSLQPSVLELDPERGRAQFMQALDNQRRMQQSSRERPEANARLAHEKEVAELHSGKRGFGYLAPGADRDRKWNPPYKPAGNPNQYLIDAILRDNAIAEYDREAPRLRDEDRARREGR